MTEATSAQIPDSKFSKLIRILFLALVASLAVMKPSIYFGGFNLPPTDFLFLAVFSLWLIFLLTGHGSFRFHKFYFLLLFYFAAMAISTAFSENPKQSFIKLSGISYLLGLAILTFNLVRTEKHFRQVIFAWLAGTAVSLFVGLLTIFLFYFQPENSLLPHTTYHYGAVPVGNFPRLSSTFISASMFCNYLNASLLMVFIAERKKFIGRAAFHAFYFSILLCAAFTISSGLGGFALALGVWFWLIFRERKQAFARTSLAGGILISILFFCLNFFALERHATAPYSIKVPFSESEVFPSPRLLVWTDSLETFTNNFLTGRGLGLDSCRVLFQNTEGSLSLLTDAHNILLSVAAQNGIFGLVAICLIMIFISRLFSPKSFKNARSQTLSILVLAFICTFIYQGMLGAFEDARHLWVLTGLILSAESITKMKL